MSRLHVLSTVPSRLFRPWAGAPALPLRETAGVGSTLRRPGYARVAVRCLPTGRAGPGRFAERLSIPSLSFLLYPPGKLPPPPSPLVRVQASIEGCESRRPPSTTPLCPPLHISTPPLLHCSTPSRLQYPCSKLCTLPLPPPSRPPVPPSTVDAPPDPRAGRANRLRASPPRQAARTDHWLSDEARQAVRLPHLVLDYASHPQKQMARLCDRRVQAGRLVEATSPGLGSRLVVTSSGGY